MSEWDTILNKLDEAAPNATICIGGWTITETDEGLTLCYASMSCGPIEPPPTPDPRCYLIRRIAPLTPVD